MINDFKFFTGTKGTLDMMDDITRATASFNADTPDGHAYRRYLYHTNNGLYHQLRRSNNEMEQYFHDRDSRPDGLTAERIAEVTRRINGGETSIPFFTGGPRATRVNPNWKTKIKMFFQTISLYWDQVWGVAVFAAMATISFGLVISKLLNIW